MNIFKHECGKENHKYESRYDYGAPHIEEIEGGSISNQIMMVEASKPRTYVCDICIYCGDIKKGRG